MVFKTPLTCVQPYRLTSGSLQISLLVSLEVTGACVFCRSARSLNNKKAGALDGGIERSSGGLNSALGIQRLGGRRSNSKSNLCVSKTRADGLGYQIMERNLTTLEPDRV